MGQRARDALLGGVYLVVIAALITLSIAIFNHAFTDYTKVTLRSDSVGNALQKGSDVKVRGVLVGQVSSIDTDGDGARVHLNLYPGKADQLPANVSAQLLPKTLFGERFVALQLPSDPSGKLRSGDTIDQDRSAQAVELQKVFQDLLPVLTAVRPEQLAATLGEVAAALRDRGSDLATTVTTVGDYLDKLAPHVPQLTEDFGALAKVADTYSGAGPDIVDALSDLGTTSTTLVNQRADLRSLLGAVTSMSNTVRSFVSKSSDDIIGLSGSSLAPLKITRKYSSEFPCLTRALQAFIPRADKAFGAGTSKPGAHVVLHVVPRVRPYTTGADRPSFTSTGDAKCPYTPPSTLSGTAVAGSPDVAGAGLAAGGRTVDDLGIVNSPQENELIAELVAPQAGLTPKTFPQWSSLLLGPALRGTTVGLK